MKHSEHLLSRRLNRKALGILSAMALVATSAIAQAQPSPEWLRDAEQAPAVEQQKAPPAYGEGVKAYREGNYVQARKLFYPLHKQHPENTKVTYYLAITEAQLGRFQQARKLYEEIITLTPQSEAARLAQEGLSYLPADASMDLPPRFQGSSKASVVAQPLPMAGQNAQTGMPGQQSVIPGMPAMPGMPGMPTMPGMAGMPGTAMPPNMSSQDMMALQMLMGQSGGNGGNNGGGFNPMPWMMQGMANPSDPNGGQNYDPATMSNMLMNQMMQNYNFGFDSDKKDD